MTIVRAASGAQHVLRHGDLTAEIASVGASLRSFRWGPRDLVLPYDAHEMRPAYRGAVLAPWPNRVAGGRWEWRGERQQLALTEPERGHALHGLVAWSDWRPTRVRSDTEVTLATTIWPQPGYPFPLDLAITWSLAAEGLRGELVVENVGAADAPFGCGIHPYLVAPTGDLGEWTLHLPAQRRLLTDAAKVPTELVPVAAEHDFRTPRRLGDAAIDHAFTSLDFDDRGEVGVTVVDRRGEGARVAFGEGTPWVQVCTSDWPGERGHRAAVAIEPMTCPPDALRRGDDLVVLSPGERHVTWWRIEPVAA